MVMQSYYNTVAFLQSSYNNVATIIIIVVSL